MTTFRRRRLNSSVVNAIGKFQTNLDPTGYKVLWIAFTGIKFLRLPKKTKTQFTFAIWLQTFWQDHLPFRLLKSRTSMLEQKLSRKEKNSQTQIFKSSFVNPPTHALWWFNTPIAPILISSENRRRISLKTCTKIPK